MRTTIVLLALFFLSCHKPVTSPREDEIIKTVNDFFYPETPSLYIHSPESSFQYPPVIKQLQILSINKMKGSDKTFDIIVVAEGRLNEIFIPGQNFIDTISLQLKKAQNTWLNNNMNHRISYSLVDPNFYKK